MALTSSDNVDALPSQIKKIFILHGFNTFNMQAFNELKSEYGYLVAFFERYFSYQNGSWRLLDSIPELMLMNSVTKIKPPSDASSGYFSAQDEHNPNYYFHGTSLCSFTSICSKGFLPKSRLYQLDPNSSILEQHNDSVSFANNSLLAKNYAPPNGVIMMVEIIIPEGLEAKNRELQKPTAIRYEGGLDLYDLDNITPIPIAYCYV